MDKKTINELLKKENKFYKTDRILKKKGIPKDISKIIYQFIKPCDLCRRCCNACEYYCYERCLRLNDELQERDICCVFEFERAMERIKKNKEKNNLQEEKQKEKII